MDESQPTEHHEVTSTTEHNVEYQHENNAPVIGDHEQHLNALDENPEHIEPENDVQNHDHNHEHANSIEEPSHEELSAPNDNDIDITSRKLHTDDEPIQAVSLDVVEDQHSIHNVEEAPPPHEEHHSKPSTPEQRPVVENDHMNDGAIENVVAEQDAGAGVAYEIVFEGEPKSAADENDENREEIKIIEHHPEDQEQGQQLEESVEQSHKDETADDFAEPKIEPDILVIEHSAEMPESNDEEVHGNVGQEDENQAFLTESKSSGDIKAYNENHQNDDVFDSGDSGGMKSSVSFGAGEAEVLRTVKNGVRRKPAPMQNNIRRTMPHLNNYRRNLWGQQQQQQQIHSEMDHRSRRTKSQSPGRLFKDIVATDPADTELLKLNVAKYADLHALFGGDNQKEPDEWIKRRQAEIRSRLEQEQREMAAKEARRRVAEEAYRGWLQKKAKEKRARSHGRDRQPSNEENSERRKNREEAEIAFKAWLEKKKEEQRERLKRLQQQQLMEKDNSRPNKEDVDQAYRTWTQQKLKQKREQRLMMQAQIKELGNVVPFNYQNFNGNRFPIRSNNNGTHYYGLPPVNNNSHRISPNVSKTTKKRVSRSDSLPSIGGGGGGSGPLQPLS